MAALVARCGRCNRRLFRAKYVAIGMGYFCLKKAEREISPDGDPVTMTGRMSRFNGVTEDDQIRRLGTWGDFPTTFKFETWWAGRPLIGLPSFTGKTWRHRKRDVTGNSALFFSRRKSGPH